jgi:hypothetical protein
VREKFAACWANLAGEAQVCRAPCGIISLIFKDIHLRHGICLMIWMSVTSSVGEVAPYSFDNFK